MAAFHPARPCSERPQPGQLGTVAPSGLGARFRIGQETFACRRRGRRTDADPHRSTCRRRDGRRRVGEARFHPLAPFPDRAGKVSSGGNSGRSRRSGWAPASGICLRQARQERGGPDLKYLVMHLHRVVNLRGQPLIGAAVHPLRSTRRSLLEILIGRPELPIEPILAAMGAFNRILPLAS